MKKTFPVNINGKVFYIDEDAYGLLQNYLDRLNATFPGSERDEIVGDIEARISELFDERISQGASAIVYGDVCRVIEIMGTPSEIGEQSDCQNDADLSRDSNEENNSSQESNDNNRSVSEAPLRKRFYRSANNKVFGGVISGLATYLGWDVNIMRVLTVVLALFTQLWPMVLIYLVLWMIIPPANTPRRELEQQGTPVTVVNISQNVLSQQADNFVNTVKNAGRNSGNFFTELLRGLGKVCVAIIGLAAAGGAVLATIVALVLFIALIVYGGAFDWVFPYLSDFISPDVSALVVTAFLCLAMCIIIPCLAIAWASASYVFDFKSAAKTTIVSALIFEIIFIIATIVLFICANGMIFSNI